MAARRHRIARYEYSFDAGLGGAARLTLWGDDGAKLADIGFMEPQGAIPQPRVARDSGYAAAFMRLDALPPLIDMLRHEGPVFLTLDGEAPGDVLISRQGESRRD
jgi:hypothetical protein